MTKKTKLKRTDIIVIVDRSGSMKDIWPEEIQGLNTFIEEQKKLPGEAALTLVYFDGEIGTYYDRKRIDEVLPLTGYEFPPRGYTALLDTVGSVLFAHKARTEKADQTMLVITTDGYENASHNYTAAQIKDMIKELETAGNFQTIYLGANQDSWSVAKSLGINISNISNYDPTARGTLSKYAAVGASTMQFRSTGELKCSVQSLYDSAMANNAVVSH